MVDHNLLSSTFLVEGVLMMAVAICGVGLNTVSIFHFAKVKHQRAFHRLLLSLAIMDNLYLIASALTFSLANLSPTYDGHAWNYIVPYSLPLAQTTMTGSVYLTISLTVERYFSVVRPFNQLRNRFLRSSLALAFPGILFSFLFTLPNYFMLSTLHKERIMLSDSPLNSTILQGLTQEQIEMARDFDMVINITSLPEGPREVVLREGCAWMVLGRVDEVSIQFAEFRSNPLYVKVYVMWLHLLFNTVLPFTALLYLNAAIYKRLVSVRHVGRRSSEEQLRRREVRLARISLSIVFIFLLCHSLKIIPSFLEILGQSPETIPGVLPLSHLLITVNCSVNFLVYYMASGRALSSLIPSVRRRSRARASSTDSSLVQTQVSEMVNTSPM